MYVTNNIIERKTSNNKISLINLSKELIKSCFIFCSVEDILSLSLVCKQFYIITKELDFIFKEKCELNFCSKYNNL
jgi:hypothetical protein